MLSWIFPDYAGAKNKRMTFYGLSRPTTQEVAESEKRICHPDYFPIYFRAAVPEEMFSNDELRRLMSDFREARTESRVESIFSQALNGIPPKHPKREDFLWKLGRAVDQLDDLTAEQLAYAASIRAADYAYADGEAQRGLNIVFIAAQKLSSTPGAQRTLLGAMERAADDTFALRLLRFTENRDRNKILTDFANVNVEELKGAFVERMRRRYGPEAEIQQVNIAQGDWWAFRVWVDSSAEDASMERDFWRRFIGASRKRLAQAINFIYPGGNVTWQEDPTPIINRLFPIEETARLLTELPENEHLEEVEASGIARYQALLRGTYPSPGQL